MKRETTLDHRPIVSEYCNFIFVIMIYYYITIKEKSIIDNIHLLGLYGLGNVILSFSTSPRTARITLGSKGTDQDVNTIK